MARSDSAEGPPLALTLNTDPFACPFAWPSGAGAIPFSVPGLYPAGTETRSGGRQYVKGDPFFPSPSLTRDGTHAWRLRSLVMARVIKGLASAAPVVQRGRGMQRPLAGS
jgi:hypothetical protein